MFPKDYSHLNGNPAPLTRFYMLDGSQIDVSDLRGKKTVILFWASWCHASRPVVEKLNAIAAKYRGRKNIEFIAVSIDKADAQPKLEERIKYGKLTSVRHAFSGNAAYDESYMAFGVEDMPTIFILDQNGRIVDSGHSEGFVEEYFSKLS